VNQIPMKKYKKFFIEITNVCNLKCSFCPQTLRPPQYMEISTFSNILDQIKPYTEQIYLHVKGEPLLHPEIDKFLDVSYEKGFMTNITTNGTLINKVSEKILMKPGLRQINFSLHSFDGNEFSINKDQYISDILSFVDKAIKETEMIIALRLWNLNKDNITNIERRINSDILDAIQRKFNLDYTLEDVIAPLKGIKISERVFLNHDHIFEWPDLSKEEDSGQGFCYALRSQIAILVDGTVVPCCLDGEGVLNLGNIKNTEFSKIIDGDRATNMYNGFSNREVVEEFCRKCGFRKRFNK